METVDVAFFIDLKKAFDTVNHTIPLKNLIAMGTRHPITMISILPHPQETICICQWPLIYGIGNQTWCSSGISTWTFTIFTLYK